jgi:hypothetical protein
MAISNPPTATAATDLTKVISIIASAFEATPLTNAFIVEIDNTPPPHPNPSIDHARRVKHFATGIQDNAANGAIVLEAGNYSAVAIWETPTFRGTPFPQLGVAGPLRSVWRERVKAAQAEHLQGKPFWHLGFLARNPEGENVKGAVSCLVRPILEQARAADELVWIEAVDKHAMAVYRHWGFELVDHVVVGKGTHNELGWPEEGGQGVSGYCMVLR